MAVSENAIPNQASFPKVLLPTSHRNIFSQSQVRIERREVKGLESLDNLHIRQALSSQNNSVVLFGHTLMLCSSLLSCVRLQMPCRLNNTFPILKNHLRSPLFVHTSWSLKLRSTNSYYSYSTSPTTSPTPPQHHTKPPQHTPTTAQNVFRLNNNLHNLSPSNNLPPPRHPSLHHPLQQHPLHRRTNHHLFLLLVLPAHHLQLSQ